MLMIIMCYMQQSQICFQTYIRYTIFDNYNYYIYYINITLLNSQCFRDQKNKTVINFIQAVILAISHKFKKKKKITVHKNIFNTVFERKRNN